MRTDISRPLRARATLSRPPTRSASRRRCRVSTSRPTQTPTTFDQVTRTTRAMWVHPRRWVGTSPLTTTTTRLRLPNSSPATARACFRLVMRTRFCPSRTSHSVARTTSSGTSTLATCSRARRLLPCARSRLRSIPSMSSTTCARARAWRSATPSCLRPSTVASLATTVASATMSRPRRKLIRAASTCGSTKARPSRRPSTTSTSSRPTSAAMPTSRRRQACSTRGSRW